MSTTATAVQARIPTARLVALTNPNDKTAGTVNTTVLEYAVTDMATFFATEANQTYDDTDAAHLALGVQGTVAVLIQNLGQSADESMIETWRSAVRAYRARSARGRVLPQTNILYETTNLENQGRPVFDPSRFDRQTLAAPPAANEDD